MVYWLIEIAPQCQVGERGWEVIHVKVKSVTGVQRSEERREVVKGVIKIAQFEVQEGRREVVKWLAATMELKMCERFWEVVEGVIYA